MTNEEAIMYLQDIKKGKYQQYPLEQNEALDLAIKELERPKGKWLPKGHWHIDPQCIEYTCSICGRRIMREELLNVIEQYPFCHCGADMGGNV